MKDYIKRSQKTYMDKKKKEGWIGTSFFIPKEIKNKLIEIKCELMKEYYVKKTNN